MYTKHNRKPQKKLTQGIRFRILWVEEIKLVNGMLALRKRTKSRIAPRTIIAYYISQQSYYRDTIIPIL